MIKCHVVTQTVEKTAEKMYDESQNRVIIACFRMVFEQRLIAHCIAIQTTHKSLISLNDFHL